MSAAKCGAQFPDFAPLIRLQAGCQNPLPSGEREQG